MELTVFWLSMMEVSVGYAERILKPAWRPSYSMPDSVRLKDGDTFEYVVVGAGAAGSAVAARLALAGKDVLLIEAGGDPNFFSKKPGLANALLGSSLDYQYETVSNNESCLSYDKKQCIFSRGRCLGGSTSINYMIHTRGHPKDFDDLKIEGWAWEDMKPYFLRFEGLQDLPKLPPESTRFHNTTGPMKMQFFADPENPWHPRIVQGFEDLNFPYNPDVNAASKIGVSQVVGYAFKNERMSTARGYLSRDDVKKRLKVAKSTKCTGLILTDDDKPQGVKVIHGLLKRKMTIYAKKEIILSAGALVTPQLLMLSGVGPAEHLRQFDIPVRVDLSVGHNMSDHVLPLLFVKVDKSTSNTRNLIQAGKVVADFAELLFRQQGPFTSNGLTDVCAFLNTDCYDFDKRQLRNDSSECEVPNVQYIHAYLGRNLIPLSGPFFQNGVGLNDAVTEQLSKVNEDYALIVFSPLLLRPHSLGHVRLGSGDPEDQPAIFPNFLADKRDVDLMVKALTIVEHLMESQPFKENGADVVRLEFPGCPAYALDRVGYWRCYSRHMTQSTFHSVGTSALGRVVDARLRVRGVRRLRVADLGVMPEVPRGNTAAAAIAIGERAADFILSESYK